MVDEVVDSTGPESERQKIVFETLATTINTEIGSEKFIETLNSMKNAPIQNLQIV